MTHDGGDDARDRMFAAQQADALEAEIAWTSQLSPVARRALDAEVRRLRAIAAQQTARAQLAGELRNVRTITPPPMPAVDPPEPTE
jgi:hypothetical protein